MKLAHWYHIHADGHWQVPVHEHFAALRASKFPGYVYVGVVGTEANAEAVEKYIKKYWDWRYSAYTRASSGFEQLTLGALYSWVQDEPDDTRVLYAHTKGAFNQSPQNDDWRVAMTGAVVRNWETCSAHLDSADAAGIHWVTKELAEREGWPGISSPFFGGNFWWANVGYLKKLPKLEYGDRFDAERWIGLGNPEIMDLKPGLPEY